MRCNNCEKYISYSWRFCIYCGAQLRGWGKARGKGRVTVMYCLKCKKGRDALSVWPYIRERIIPKYCYECGEELISRAALEEMEGYGENG